MKASATDKLREWVRNWQVVGPQLDRLRRESIRNANTQDSIRQFDLAFKAAIRNTPHRQTSGLIEFQRLLRKLQK
ncbi:MAG TPA: hypothetical protein VGK82_03055 [Pyrinomonadaceae bacterium]